MFQTLTRLQPPHHCLVLWREGERTEVRAQEGRGGDRMDKNVFRLDLFPNVSKSCMTVCYAVSELILPVYSHKHVCSHIRSKALSITLYTRIAFNYVSHSLPSHSICKLTHIALKVCPVQAAQNNKELLTEAAHVSAAASAAASCSSSITGTSD